MKNHEGAQGKKNLVVMNIFIILIRVMVSCMYTYEKISQIVQFKYAHLNIVHFIEGNESLLFQNLTLWNIDYFKMVLFKKQRLIEKL